MAGVFRARSLKLNPETVVLVPALRPIPQNMSGQVGSDVRQRQTEGTHAFGDVGQYFVEKFGAALAGDFFAGVSGDVVSHAATLIYDAGFSQFVVRLDDRTVVYSQPDGKVLSRWYPVVGKPFAAVYTGDT